MKCDRCVTTVVGGFVNYDNNTVFYGACRRHLWMVTVHSFVEVKLIVL